MIICPRPSPALLAAGFGARIFSNQKRTDSMLNPFLGFFPIRADLRR